jgi:hypothetical protein
VQGGHFFVPDVNIYNQKLSLCGGFHYGFGRYSQLYWVLKFFGTLSKYGLASVAICIVCAMRRQAGIDKKNNAATQIRRAKKLSVIFMSFWVFCYLNIFSAKAKTDLRA